MLSLTCKTAIKAVIYLAAKFESGEKSGILEIAEYIAASPHTVGKMLQTLVKKNIISSTKGPNGGFHLNAKQLKLPVITIVDAIDGKGIFSACGLGLSACSATHPCPIHKEFTAVRDGFQKICKGNTVLDLCAPVNRGKAYLVR